MMIWLGRLWAAVLLYIRVKRNLQVPLEPVKLSPAERKLLDARGRQLAEMMHANGIRIPPPLPAVCDLPDPVVVGVDWSEGTDITIYTCRACGWEGSIVEDLVKHMKAHGATRLSVIPVTRPPAYRFGDRR